MNRGTDFIVSLQYCWPAENNMLICYMVISFTWSETYFWQDLFPSYLFFRRQFHAIVIFRLKSTCDLDSGSLPRFFWWIHIRKIKNSGVVTRLDVKLPKLRSPVDRVRVRARVRLGIVSNSVSSGYLFLSTFYATWTLTEICWFLMIRLTLAVLNDKKTAFFVMNLRKNSRNHSFTKMGMKNSYMCDLCTTSFLWHVYSFAYDRFNLRDGIRYSCMSFCAKSASISLVDFSMDIVASKKYLR